jgi:hypothetical protein
LRVAGAQGSIRRTLGLDGRTKGSNTLKLFLLHYESGKYYLPSWCSMTSAKRRKIEMIIEERKKSKNGLV